MGPPSPDQKNSKKCKKMAKIGENIQNLNFWGPKGFYFMALGVINPRGKGYSAPTQN